MTLTVYNLIPWREQDDLQLSYYSSYRDAQADGEKFYQNGYLIEILEIDEDGEIVSCDI